MFGILLDFVLPCTTAKTILQRYTMLCHAEAYRWNHPLSDQLPGEHTDGTIPTPWAAYRWNHPLPYQLSVKHTDGTTPFQINSKGSIQMEPSQLPGVHTGGTTPPRSTLCRAYRCGIPILQFLFTCHYTYTHLLKADRSLVVGYIQTVHMLSFLCTNHIHP